MSMSAKEIFEGRVTGLHLDELNPAMDKKLIINVAPTGSFTTREQNPYQPYTLREIADSVVECVEDGASVWHIHCRDDDGIPSKDPAKIKQMEDMVFDRCDVVTSMNVIGDYGKQGVDLIRSIVDGLVEAGPRYIETAVMTPYTTSHHEKWTRVVTEKYLRESVEYLQERGIKPEYQMHNYTCVKNVSEWVIKPGIAKPPHLTNVVQGWHGRNYSAPTAPEPWGHLYMFSMLNVLPPDNVVGFCAGGHSWLPVTVMAIMMGVDMIRVGMEDTIWMYPHRDDLIQNCRDTVRKVAAIARELGRELATPAEARQILGLPPLGS